MNPLTNVKNIKKLSEQDLKRGGKSSWHDQYKDSAWLFIGGLPYDLTEGDIICVFSQYGEVVNINLVRDKVTGKQKGYCFLCYEDQRSTILAVDNLNSIKILNRTLRVDHVENYKVPKESKKNPVDEETKLLREEGCAPFSKAINPMSSVPVPQIKTEPNSSDDIQLPPRLPIGSAAEQPTVKKESKKHKKSDKKKVKKSKKEKKSKKRKRKASTSSSDSDSSSSDSDNDEQKRRRK